MFMIALGFCIIILSILFVFKIGAKTVKKKESFVIVNTRFNIKKKIK